MPVLNRICLHPSGLAFITTETDGSIRLWGISSYLLLQEIKPTEYSVVAATWHQNFFISSSVAYGGSEYDASARNLLKCWNLTTFARPAEKEELVQQQGNKVVRRIWSFGAHLFTIAVDPKSFKLTIWVQQAD